MTVIVIYMQSCKVEDNEVDKYKEVPAEAYWVRQGSMPAIHTSIELLVGNKSGHKMNHRAWVRAPYTLRPLTPWCRKTVVTTFTIRQNIADNISTPSYTSCLCFGCFELPSYQANPFSLGRVWMSCRFWLGSYYHYWMGVQVADGYKVHAWDKGICKLLPADHVQMPAWKKLSKMRLRARPGNLTHGIPY